MDVTSLEGIARSVLEEHGFDAGPVDALDLAEALRIEVKWHARGHAYRFGRRAFVPLNTRASRVHGLLAHEIAHVLLDDFEFEQSEPAAGYLGAALLVPRRLLDRQLVSGWDLHALLGYHVNASAELLARRITEVRHATAAIYDNGRLKTRAGAPVELADEQSMVDAVLRTDAPLRRDPQTGAWPFIDGRWRRVVVLGVA